MSARRPQGAGRRLTPGLLAAGLIWLLAAPACAAAPEGAANPAERPHVVMIVFDELPLMSLLGAGGTIDEARYPAFAALARSSTWFANATAISGQTRTALPAILDGRWPRARLPATARGHPRTLFTLLGRRHGYGVVASEEASDLCPRPICPAPPPRPGLSTRNLNAGRGARFASFVDQIRPTARPTLYFNHALLPHVPYQFLPSGRLYRRTSGEVIPGLTSPRGFHDRWLTRQALQRHLLQLGFVDRLLGRLLERLHETGLYDRTLIVVTADHGYSFLAGVRDRRTITRRNVHEIASVPLLVKAPGQRVGSVDRAYVRTLDVLPTIAGILRTRVPWRVAGRSAFAPATRRRRLVRVLLKPTGTLRLSARAFERRRAALLRRNLRLFGWGAGPPGLYGIGPRPELLGRRVEELPISPPGRVRARLNQTAELGAVDLSSGFLPVHVTGRVRGGRPRAKRDIAVAVNGRVAGVGRTFYLRGSARESLSVMVPESSIQAGVNRVDVFEVTRAGGRLLLRRLGGT